MIMINKKAELDKIFNEINKKNIELIALENKIKNIRNKYNNIKISSSLDLVLGLQNKTNINFTINLYEKTFRVLYQGEKLKELDELFGFKLNRGGRCGVYIEHTFNY